MISLKINDIFNIFNIEKTQLNIVALKGLVSSMIKKGLAYEEKQNIVFNKDVFLHLWTIYLDFLNYFDVNYNRKTDFSLFFTRLIEGLYDKETLNFYALFCPGYTRYGYKDYLGHTTIWKLGELKKIKDMIESYQISSNMLCFYSDVFLENCEEEKNPYWFEQMKYNRELFHQEGEKYFSIHDVRDMSSLEIFSHDCDLEGYVDEEIIKNIHKRLYDGFLHCNEKFYRKMDFSEEQIKYRNDRLLTMYKLFSDYLNTQQSSIYLPMENMYERENIFSSNNTCTMYLRLKKKVEE